MDWDKIKGAFRRTTQLFNQQVRHVAVPTLDAEYEGLVTIVDGLAGLAQRTSDRMRRLAIAVDSSVALVHEASLDPPPQQFAWDDMTRLNAKLAHAAQALSPHSGYAKKLLVDHAMQLDRFVGDVKALDKLKEERKSTMLEYDFFRHKVAQMRNDPPSDPQRIPRNEGRADEFKTRLDAQSGKLKQALQGLMSTGERLCSAAHQLMASELHRFADESSRAWAGAHRANPTISLPMPPQVAAAAALVSQSVANFNSAQQQQQPAPPNTSTNFMAGGQPVDNREVASLSGTMGATLGASTVAAAAASSSNFLAGVSDAPERPKSVQDPANRRGQRQTVDDPFRM